MKMSFNAILSIVPTKQKEDRKKTSKIHFEWLSAIGGFF
jgi:hypothetical protein